MVRQAQVHFERDFAKVYRAIKDYVTVTMEAEVNKLKDATEVTGDFSMPPKDVEVHVERIWAANGNMPDMFDKPAQAVQ